MFGIDIINIIKKEHPEWFDDHCKEMIIKACEEAFVAEALLDDAQPAAAVEEGGLRAGHDEAVPQRRAAGVAGGKTLDGDHGTAQAGAAAPARPVIPVVPA